MEKISASIVAFKTEPILLKRAMASFLNSSITGKLTIIDNSPGNKLKKYCSGSSVEYIHTGKNIGYGRAHNISINQNLNRSTYHLVLNPDVYFDSLTLEKIYNFMEGRPQAGLVMPKILNENHELQMTCKLLPSPFNLATRRFLPFKKAFLEMNDRYEMKKTGYDQIMNVPFLSGCFMFLRTSALKETGLFDERFFLYAEDTDLSRRIHQQFETLFFPNAEIVHLHARGSYKTIKLTYQNLKSAIQYFNKWGWFLDSERNVVNRRALTVETDTDFSEKSMVKVRVA